MNASLSGITRDRCENSASQEGKAASRKPFPYTQPYRNSIITQNRCRHI